jgi:phenylpyruvate tautomerase PptA (4-oxalocrotonate tautomerase family)
MAIVTVELVVETGQSLAPGLAQAVADAVGRTLDSPPGQTWVRVHTLDRHQYAENESSLDVGQLPVFVNVLERHVPASAALHARVGALTQAIAQALGRPATSVHIEYAPAALNRLAFGGKLVQLSGRGDR